MSRISTVVDLRVPLWVLTAEMKRVMGEAPGRHQACEPHPALLDLPINLLKHILSNLDRNDGLRLSAASRTLYAKHAEALRSQRSERWFTEPSPHSGSAKHDLRRSAELAKRDLGRLHKRSPSFGMHAHVSTVQTRIHADSSLLMSPPRCGPSTSPK